MAEELRTIFISDRGFFTEIKAQFSDNYPWRYIKATPFPMNPLKAMINRKKLNSMIMGNLEPYTQYNDFSEIDPFTRRATGNKIRIIWQDLLGNTGIATRTNLPAIEDTQRIISGLQLSSNYFREEYRDLLDKINLLNMEDATKKQLLNLIGDYQDMRKKMLTIYDVWQNKSGGQ